MIVIAYILQRVAQAIFVLLTVALVAFSMFRFLGDPTTAMLGAQETAADHTALRTELALSAPLPIQYYRFIRGVAVGDFGVSYRHGRPVLDIITERLPATLELAAVSGLISLLVGVALGVFAATRPETLQSKFFMTVSLIGISLPTFLIGVLLMRIFAVKLQWLPAFGRGEVIDLGWWSTGLLTGSGLRSLVLPAITLSIYQMTLVMRLVRGALLEIEGADYIRCAKARGLSWRSIYLRHGLRNIMMPVITLLALQFGYVTAFAIVTETVFQWPGVGLLFIEAVAHVDIPVMATYLMLVALIFIVINLLVDLLYFAIDPRVRDAFARGAT